jgi:hypothetical protein
LGQGGKNMSFERFSVKKVYYYVICATTLFILLWGAIDVASAALSLTAFKGPTTGMDMSAGGPQSGMAGDARAAAEPMMDEYYQSRMAMDRMGDSLARLLVAGSVFLYASMKVRELESKEI